MKKHYLLTPGPTPIPPEVAIKSALPILHHRTSEFGEIFEKVVEGLKWVFQTKNDVFVMASSGTGAMESAVVNLLSPNDKVLVASCGVFGNRWAKICQAYGLEPILIEEEWGKAVVSAKVQEAINKNPDIKVVFTTHTETSTGTLNDLKTIGEIVAKTKAILVVDSVSGLGSEELKTDEWILDVVVSGAQKGLMNAPGLAFVSVSAKAWSLVENAKLPRFYWDYRKMKKSVAEKQTPFTPAVTLLVAQLEALNMLREEGLEKIWAKYKNLASATQSGIKAIGLKLFSSSPCNVVTSAHVPDGVDGGKIVKKLRENYGISIAGGQEHLKGKIIRLAHMGYINSSDLVVGLAGLEKVLDELGYKFEHGKSVSTFQEVLKS